MLKLYGDLIKISKISWGNVIKRSLLLSPFFRSDDVENIYAIIELQGDIKTADNKTLDGKFLGDLHFTKTGSPVLIIGHNLMYGKQMQLDPPLALLERKASDGNNAEYLVKTIVTKKLLFKIRPKPIVASNNNQ